MRVAESAANVQRDVDDFLPAEPAASVELFLEVGAFDQLHGVEQATQLLAEARETHDVGMVELLERLDLAAESAAEIRIVGVDGREHLDGPPLARLGRDAFIDGAHAAAANLTDNFVGAKPLEFHGAFSLVSC